VSFSRKRNPNVTQDLNKDRMKVMVL
jgi:hypothetical protein